MGRMGISHIKLVCKLVRWEKFPESKEAARVRNRIREIVWASHWGGLPGDMQANEASDIRQRNEENPDPISSWDERRILDSQLCATTTEEVQGKVCPLYASRDIRTMMGCMKSDCENKHIIPVGLSQPRTDLCHNLYLLYTRRGHKKWAPFERPDKLRIPLLAVGYDFDSSNLFKEGKRRHPIKAAYDKLRARYAEAKLNQDQEREGDQFKLIDTPDKCKEAWF